MKRETLARYMECAEDLRIELADELMSGELSEEDYKEVRGIYKSAGELYVALNHFRIKRGM